MSENVLDVVQVTKRFGNIPALSDISFHVGRGEVVALLGDNGAGKSTMVSCIAGLQRVDSGHIALNGEDIHGNPSASKGRHRGIGVVYQDLALFDNLSIAENLFAGAELCWPSRLGGLGVIRKAKMISEARNTLARLEVRIPDPTTPVALLSGGQRQAIAVSKGVAFAHQLLVLDEPTAALGIRESANVHKLILQLPSTGLSVILISHNLDEVLGVADRAVILRQGTKVGEVTLDGSAGVRERIVSMIVGGEPAADSPSADNVTGRT